MGFDRKLQHRLQRGAGFGREGHGRGGGELSAEEGGHARGAEVPVVAELAEAEQDFEEVAIGFLLGAGSVVVASSSTMRVGCGVVGRGFIFPEETLSFRLQSLVFFAFVVEEVNPVDIFVHLWETEIHEFHFFATPETDGAHESLEK